MKLHALLNPGLFILSILLTSLPATAVEMPPAGSVSLKKAVVSGKNCVAVSDAAQLSGVETLKMGVLIKGMAEKKFSFKKARAVCNFVLDFEIPAGWQAAFSTATADLKQNLGPGVVARVDVAGWFGVGDKGGDAGIKIRGPQNSAEQIQLSFKKPAWSPCGGNKTGRLRAAVAVNNRKAAGIPGEVTLESLTVNLKWRPCKS